MQDETGADGGHTGSDGDQDTARYGAIETSEGETIIYDREQPTAWLQSDYAVSYEPS
jgi:hypothetical protein